MHVEQDGDVLRLTAPTEQATGIQKQIALTMDGSGTHVRIAHRLTNCGVWPVSMAAWALTMCAPGGVGIAPLPPEGEHDDNLQPSGTISVWAYTHLRDPRWVVGNRCILLRHDPQRSTQEKIGVFTPDGWVACANHGHLLLKTFAAEAGRPYPDRGVNVEMYANDALLEIETLGPLTTLEPGELLEHVEEWHLLDDVAQPAGEDEALTSVFPRVEEIKHAAQP